MVRCTSNREHNVPTSDLLVTYRGITLLVWWQNGDLGLGWVLEYIQRFIIDSGRWEPTYHKSD